jgi:hypothetical protein
VLGELHSGTTETRFARDPEQVLARLEGGPQPGTVREAAFQEEQYASGAPWGVSTKTSARNLITPRRSGTSPYSLMRLSIGSAVANWTSVRPSWSPSPQTISHRRGAQPSATLTGQPPVATRRVAADPPACLAATASNQSQPVPRRPAAYR